MFNRLDEGGFMNFSLELRESIADLHLLKHPFYKRWEQGELKQEELKEYAENYYHHVKAFPRYISAAHSNCEDLAKRKILLENLADEEGLSGTDHPELWLRFAEGVGVPKENIKSSNVKEVIENVIETFLSNSQSSYEEGLASLYAYEYQIPEIAETKIKGLRDFYGVNEERALSFFEVHKTADVFHRAACEKLLDKFNNDDQVLAKKAARKSAQVLWDFLTYMEEKSYAA